MRALRVGILIVMAFMIAGRSHAADLRVIERKIAREPAYQTQSVGYCLLVFGQKAQTRIWLVHDGDKLYVDRNGDGDLTEANEVVTAKAGEWTEATEGIFHFEAGNLYDGKLTHHRLEVSFTKIDYVADRDPEVKARLEENPRYRGVAMSLEVELPGKQGDGKGGRVRHILSYRDMNGLLEFGKTPAEAPIIHFGGRLQLTLFNMRPTLTIGRQEDLVLTVGTPGLGKGTTALVAYEKFIPADAHPQVQITYAAADGSSLPFTELYVLKERCCTVNLHGPVRTPDKAAPGKAKVVLSFPLESSFDADTTEHELVVLPAPPGPKLEAISSRLKATLVHPDKVLGTLVGLAYSPDGKRIIAGHYPGGTIQVWDAATGRQLTRLETGEEYRSTANFFFLSPDWKRVYSFRRREKYDRIQTDDRRLYRWSYSGDIRAWDLETGELLETYQHDPPRGYIIMEFSPDARSFYTREYPPGESERRLPLTATLWDAQTGQRRALPDDLVGQGTYSPDGKQIAIVQANKDGYSTAINLVNVATARQTLSIPIVEKFASASVFNFTPDGQRLIGDVRAFPGSKEYRNWQSCLKLWDAKTGRELACHPAPEKNVMIMYVTLSPNGQMLAGAGWGEERGRVYLFDVADLRVKRVIDLTAKRGQDERVVVQKPAFSPDGRWLAVVTQVHPVNRGPEYPPEEIAQPRIHLIEVASGELRETLVAPQGFSGSACFSPDGKTLATSGKSQVQLWDLSVPPGELAGR